MLQRAMMRTTILDLVRVEWNISIPPSHHSATAVGSYCSQCGNDAEENYHDYNNPGLDASGMEHFDTSMFSEFQSPTLRAKITFESRDCPFP
jgi:hypothetical protein